MGSFRRNKDRGRKQPFSVGFKRDKQRGSFDRDSEGGFRRGSPRFGSKPFDRSSRRPLDMHKVICDRCGKECEVPFRPTGNKHIFCRECFGKKGDSSSKLRFRESGGSSDELAKINQKLDKIMQALKIR